MRVIELNASVTDSNDREAEALRKELHEKGLLLVNLMSSPGSGKTTLLSALISDLKQELKIAVLEADIDSDVDAVAVERLGVDAIQAHTDGMCHMDASMTRRALLSLGAQEAQDSPDSLDLPDYDLVFLENVGNLICPAEFDTGAAVKMMILSIPEGDDKPLKYPLMFSQSDILVITKMDTKDYFDFDMEACVREVKRLNPDIRIFPVSAKSGEGMKELEAEVRERMAVWKGGRV